MFKFLKKILFNVHPTIRPESVDFLIDEFRFEVSRVISDPEELRRVQLGIDALKDNYKTFRKK